MPVIKKIKIYKNNIAFEARFMKRAAFILLFALLVCLSFLMGRKRKSWWHSCCCMERLKKTMKSAESKDFSWMNSVNCRLCWLLYGETACWTGSHVTKFFVLRFYLPL